tara:strand:+ start:59662 stop:60135 length:474 start_codon:yes stop_codon:yes gene_type:complete
MSFDYMINKKGDVWTMHLKGHMDEDVKLDQVDFEEVKCLEIDFEAVASINSCGIREWIKWISELHGGLELIYKNCPKFIVDQINMIAGFLPDNGRVQSFYVPYYSEDSDREKMILFTEGKEYTSNSINAPETIQDESGEEMEIDVIESKYFRFLQAG